MSWGIEFNNTSLEAAMDRCTYYCNLVSNNLRQLGMAHLSNIPRCSILQQMSYHFLQSSQNMFFLCPVVHAFWESIFKTISSGSDLNLPTCPEIASVWTPYNTYLSLNPNRVFADITRGQTCHPVALEVSQMSFNIPLAWKSKRFFVLKRKKRKKTLKFSRQEFFSNMAMCDPF